MFLAASNNKRSPRPESPGGYFTLSDSDGASNPGTESSLEDHELNQQNKMYKMYVRSKSEPPKRPKSPKNLENSTQDIDAPPRPPPPLSYTSTLPPPVPKKMSKKGSKNQKPPPPPLAHFGGPNKAKPLQRVQPLQIQSPSMIQILQPKSPNSTSSDDNSVDGKLTFVTSFRNATKNVEPIPIRPPLKSSEFGYMKPTKTAVLKQKISTSSSSSSFSDENNAESVSKKSKKSKPKNSAENKLKKLKNSVVCNLELKRSASDKTIKKSKKENNLSKSETNINKNPIHSLIKFYESSQEEHSKGKQQFVVLEDKDINRISNTSHLSQLSQLSAEKIQTWLQNPISDLNVTQVSILDKYVTDMISLADVPSQIDSDTSSNDSDKYPRVIMKSPKVTKFSKKEVNKTKNNKVPSKKKVTIESPKCVKKFLSAGPKNKALLEEVTKNTQESLDEIMKNLTPTSKKQLDVKKEPSKVKSKARESLKEELNKRTESPKNSIFKRPESPKVNFFKKSEPGKSPLVKRPESPKTTAKKNENLKNLENRRPESPKVSLQKMPESPKVSLQKGPESPKVSLQKRPESPRANLQKKPESPKVSLQKRPESPKVNLQKRPESPKFNLQKRPESPKVPPRKRSESPKIPESQNKPEVPKIQSEVIQEQNAKPQEQSKNVTFQVPEKSITVIEDKIPSEEDIEKGVFTEVSCAGHVTKSNFHPPIPSPRVKKKARKEQMLLEHKEKGHQALSLVMKNLQKKDGEVDEGLQCLDDLCAQSRHIQEDINKNFKKDAENADEVGAEKFMW